MEKKKTGIEIHGNTSLHGKRARLVRGDVEVAGVLLSQDNKVNTRNMIFQFVDANGKKSISPVTSDEMDNIQDALLDYE